MFKDASNPADNKAGLSLKDGNIDLDSVGENVETKPKPEDNVDLDEFFAGMDKRFNGAIFDDPDVTPPESVDPSETVGEDTSVAGEPEEDGEVAKLKKELSELTKRYEGSSSEAKRLYNELQNMKQYSDYVPILETMRQDPGLIDHVRNYLDGNSAPRSVKEELGLDEDFFFDGDEAISDPNSDSAKVFQTMIDKGVARQLAQQNQIAAAEQQAASAELARETEITRFKEESGMDDTQFEGFMDFAKNTKLTLNDIYYLMNRENREKEIANKAIEEQSNKLKKMRGQPSSLASAGAASEPISEERQIFDAIKNANKTANIFEEYE